MRRLLMALAPMVATYAWRNRRGIRDWVAERRDRRTVAPNQPAAV